MDKDYPQFEILHGTFPWVIASDSRNWLALNLETGKTRRVPVRQRATHKAYAEVLEIVRRRNLDHHTQLAQTAQNQYQQLKSRAFKQTKRKTMSVIYYLPQDLAYLLERLPSLPVELLIAMSEANCAAYSFEYKINADALERFQANSSAHQGQPLSYLGNPNELVTILRELQLLRYNTKSDTKDHLSQTDSERFEEVCREVCIRVLASIQVNQTLRIHDIEFRALSSSELVATIYNKGFERQQRRIKTKLETASNFYDQWFARAVQLIDQHQATIDEVLALPSAD